MTNVEINVDTSTISKEMKLKAAYEVLKDKALIQEMINAHKIRFDELEGFHETIEENFDRNISLLHKPSIEDLRNKITNETANGGNIKADTAKEMLSQSFLAIKLFKRKKDWISGELIRSGYARSEKVEKAISDFKVMIQTLEKCKDQFDGFEKDDKLDKIEKLMAELGLEHADLLKRIPENVLKDRNKKAESTTSTGTTTSNTTKVTYEHFFVNDSDEVVTGEFADRGTVPDKNKDKTPNGKPAKFFDWATKKRVPAMKRSDFRVGTMTEDKMNEIKAQYLAHIKPAVTESIQSNA